MHDHATTPDPETRLLARLRAHIADANPLAYDLRLTREDCAALLALAEEAIAGRQTLNGGLARTIVERHAEFRAALIEATAQIVHYEGEMRRHRRAGGGWVVPWAEAGEERQGHCRIEARNRVNRAHGERLW